MVSNNNGEKRPKITLSAAITLDGQIASLTGDNKLSNTEDWRRVHHLRAENEAIMVGSGTILTDDSKLTIKPEFFESDHVIKNPIRIVVTSSGMIPLDSRIITFRPDIPTIIATTKKCSSIKRKEFLRKGCEVILCGEGPLVNLRHLVMILYKDYKINNLLLEGGSKLNGNMVAEKLIDEIQVSIAPVLGGNGIPFFSLPYAMNSFDQSPFFEILNQKIFGDMIWLNLKIHYKPRSIM
ncbi:MAG: RibD family protein [Candidatus Hodarchaeales archaeon]|jgi:riboflavin-specific deaminase-like protein